MQALNIILAIAPVVFAFLTWRVYMRQAWLYGALGSHSTFPE